MASSMMWARLQGAVVGGQAVEPPPLCQGCARQPIHGNPGAEGVSCPVPQPHQTAGTPRTSDAPHSCNTAPAVAAVYSKGPPSC